MSTPAPAYVSPTGMDQVYVGELGHGLRPARYGHRVLPGEACGAETRTRRAGSRDQAVEVEVAQGVGTEVVAHLLDGEVSGEELAAGAGVHPEVARPPVG